MSKRRVLAGIMAAVLVGAAAYAADAYSRDLERAHQRRASRSQVIASRFGRLEYATAGKGRPLLMIHGTGGGFDQGLSFASALVGHGYRLIAPSRFGYLRSDFPPEPSSENQADAFVDLLDHLGIRKAPVVGGSAGALSAVQFALRHPERCSALVLLVPAANVRGHDPVRMSLAQEWAVRALLSSDLLYWSALRTVPDALVGSLLATDPWLLDTASGEERKRAYRILEELMPIGARARGMLNDATLAGNPARVDFTRLAVPTLVISVEDDRFGTAATAREMAATVPDARLVIYPRGGHIWIGHDQEVWAEVARFLSARGLSRPVRHI